MRRFDTNGLYEKGLRRVKKRFFLILLIKESFLTKKYQIKEASTDASQKFPKCFNQTCNRHRIVTVTVNGSRCCCADGGADCAIANSATQAHE